MMVRSPPSPLSHRTDVRTENAVLWTIGHSNQLNSAARFPNLLTGVTPRAIAHT
jgi:hypothetical protein